MGRHSAPGDDEDEDVVVANPRGAHADLHLLRESPALRARCIAGIVVPFAVFTALLILMGSIGEFLLWMWLPTVIAGMLVGIFLDLAHRRAGTTAR